MSINISEAGLQDATRIDQFLASNDSSLPYHRIQWLKAIKIAYDHDYIYLVASEFDEIVGVLPICLFKGLSGKKSFCSLPFCDVGGVVAKNHDVTEALVNFAFSQLNPSNCDRLEIRQRTSDSCSPNSLSGQKVSMLLELSPNSEILMKGFKSKLRSQIKKAEKNGLTFESTSSTEGIEPFYRVFSRNMRDLGSPVHAKKWFEALQREYGDSMVVGKVYYGQRVIGAGVIILIGKNVVIPWASTLREYNKLAPNMWLYWNLLRIACDRGCKIFDFGRSTYQEGTYKFKEQWGARPVKLDWRFFDGSGRDFDDLSTVSGMPRQIIESIWRRFPLSLANSLGPRLRKHISL